MIKPEIFEKTGRLFIWYAGRDFLFRPYTFFDVLEDSGKIKTFDPGEAQILLGHFPRGYDDGQLIKFREEKTQTMAFRWNLVQTVSPLESTLEELNFSGNRTLRPGRYGEIYDPKTELVTKSVRFGNREPLVYAVERPMNGIVDYLRELLNEEQVISDSTHRCD